MLDMLFWDLAFEANTCKNPDDFGRLVPREPEDVEISDDLNALIVREAGFSEDLSGVIIEDDEERLQFFIREALYGKEVKR